MNDGWEAATFEGAEEAQARALAATTPDERFRWLMDALDLAAATGARAGTEAGAPVRSATPNTTVYHDVIDDTMQASSGC